MHKYMGRDKVDPRVLRELANEVDKTLSIIFEKSWQSIEVPTDWKRGNITLFLKREKRNTRGTTGQSVSPLCPVRPWSRSSWKLC